ncbi:ABC-type transport system permease [Dasineura jujubifolia toursvirus 2a]|nr:ABC-type transport system permease [Dasineura jujubifolia toursvirus 2a]
MSTMSNNDDNLEEPKTITESSKNEIKSPDLNNGKKIAKFNIQNYYAANKYNNKELRKFIRTRYLFYKHIFKNKEFVHIVLRLRSRSLIEHCKGFFWGICDGACTGLCLGGKWGGNGGWLMGGITQLISLLVSPILGCIHGAILGLLSNRVEISEILKDYRYMLGGTGGHQNDKLRTMVHPGGDKHVIVPRYITAGDVYADESKSRLSTVLPKTVDH